MRDFETISACRHHLVSAKQVSAGAFSIPWGWRAAFESISIDVVAGVFLHFKVQVIAGIGVRPRQVFIDLDPKARLL